MKKFLLSVVIYSITISCMMILLTALQVPSPTKDKGPVQPSQIVLYGSSMKGLANQINTYFNKGYKVTHMVAQSVSTSVNSRTNCDCGYQSPHRDIEGQVMVILQK